MGLFHNIYIPRMVTYIIGRPKRAANHPTRSLEVLKCNLEIALSAAVSVVPKME